MKLCCLFEVSGQNLQLVSNELIISPLHLVLEEFKLVSPFDERTSSKCMLLHYDSSDLDCIKPTLITRRVFHSMSQHAALESSQSFSCLNACSVVDYSMLVPTRTRSLLETTSAHTQ